MQQTHLLTHLTVMAVVVGAPAWIAAADSETAGSRAPRPVSVVEATTDNAQDPPRRPRPPRAPRPPRPEAVGPERTEAVAHSVKVGPDATLVLSNVGGTITIEGDDTDTIRIDATKRARGRTETEAAAHLAGVKVEVLEFPNRLEVRTRYGEAHTRVAVDFAIRMPRRGNVELRSVSGDITLRDVQGEVRAETVSGRVVASGLGRTGQLKSVSGDVEVSKSEMDGDLSAHSVSGHVRTEAVRARALTAATVKGDIDVRDVRCDRASLSSIAGNVVYASTLSPRGRYELKSHAGNVQLVVDGTVGFELDASSFSGAIETDWSLTTTDTSPARGPRRTLRGVHGDGSAQVSASSFTGTVEVLRRPR